MMREFRLREQGKRLPLHHGGWLGAFNQHKHGNVVTSQPVIDWEHFTGLDIPDFWKTPEEETT